ncbi:hypothetical protein QR680_003755 [Steinernema hermaphroditum]|uniref:Alpha-galactosidase n=1 Tax=Steinernema hermaphroditum TaxID=289476 RepID=A0AA39LSV6_9BILA|nr:hypothetical protein QR680_003755 [Steinernema hermaphroditum]
MHSAAVLGLVLLALGASGLDNGLVRKPPMGWMSWTKYYCEIDCVKHPFGCINEDLYMAQADRMSKDGYRDVGYEYIHIDDCWMANQRAPDGQLVANATRFPSGIKALSKYMHDRGLKLGIYEDIGTKTCGGYPGSATHLKTDADTFASWDVDYLKLDGCWIEEDEMPEQYENMEGILNGTGRQIVYSCSWPAYLIDQPQKQDYKLIAQYCNLWRNFDDISMSWSSILSIINYYDHNQDRQIPYNGPGQWFDPDMIIGGNTEITYDQARVQMTIWSMWSAPLIMSNDLRTVDEESKKILQNREVIAIDQDPMGIMGRLVANTTDLGVYVKPVVPRDTAKNTTSYAVAILNRSSSKKHSVTLQLSHLGMSNAEGYACRDLWELSDLGTFRPRDSFNFDIKPTAVQFIKCSLPNL